MSRKTLIGLLVLATFAVAGASYAQRRGGRGGRGFGGATYTIRRPDDNSFTGDFTFCRLMFRQAPDGDGAGWGVDYPRADQNLSIRLSELTKARVNFDKSEEPNYYVMQATDPHLFECPFVMMTEPGGTYFGEDEAKEVRKIFPDEHAYPIIDVPIDHATFHTLYDVKAFPQIPGIGVWTRWHTTSERGADSAIPHARAILDAKGRIMFFMSHNTDFGDGYEREGDDPSYFYTFSVPGYAVGIDILLYAMTH